MIKKISAVTVNLSFSITNQKLEDCPSAQSSYSNLFAQTRFFDFQNVKLLHKLLLQDRLKANLF